MSSKTAILLVADDGHAPHLVRVEPGEMHVRDDSGGEAEVAEDDVLDARVQERLAARPGLDRLLADEVEDHGEVVGAEAPERVLVLADLPEVLAVAVDVEEAPELLRVDQVLQLGHARVVEEQVAGHEHERALLGEGDELLAEGRRKRERLLDEDVLAGEECLARELEVRHDGRRDGDGVEPTSASTSSKLVVLRASGKRAPKRSRRSSSRSQIHASSAPSQLVEVPREVRAPVAEAHRSRAS